MKDFSSVLAHNADNLPKAWCFTWTYTKANAPVIDKFDIYMKLHQLIHWRKYKK